MSGAVIAGLKNSLAGFPAVRLDGPRLYLRPPRQQDWADWAELREGSRSFLAPWEPTWPADALTRAAYLKRLRRQMQDWREDSGYTLLVFALDDTIMGGVSLSHVRRGVAQTASLGYWIGPGFARRGYMREAVGVTLGFAFGAIALHRVEAACLPSNEPSRRLLESIGFRQEGFAKAYLRIAGAWRDHLLFAMLSEEFQGRRCGRP